MMFPKKKWSAPKRVKTPEAALQTFTNEYLSLMHIDNIRIPDWVWRWLHAVAPSGILMYFKKTFAGIADNVCFLPINDKYSLCLHLELKTKSALHGKQKSAAKRQKWQIAHTPEEVMAIVEQFKKDAEHYEKESI